MSGNRTWRTPRDEDLGLRSIDNKAGIRVSVLPNGSVFAIEHRDKNGATLVNQVLASPVDGGIGRILLRVGGANPALIETVGPQADARMAVGGDQVVWEGTSSGVRHRVVLRLHSARSAWLWSVEATNERNVGAPIDAILIQDLGLGARGFITNNEAYASQYIDHHIARDSRYGPVILSRQNLAQNGRHPWVAHGCLDGASAMATDAIQLFGPEHRDLHSPKLAFGTRIGERRLQHEVACAALQSSALELRPGETVSWRFVALFEADHPAASTDDELAKVNDLAWPQRDDVAPATAGLRRSVLRAAPPAKVFRLTRDALAQRHPDRFLEEVDGDQLLSFFAPDPPHNRHVVLREKELLVTRRHGTLLRSGQAMLPDEATLCATCWMHGVFAAQLTIGNTAFHKLFSVSRDPYNIVRSSGLRMMIDAGEGWRLLTIPSVFEMGLNDCRWIYALDDRVVTVRAIASGDDAAMQWRIASEGAPSRLLLFGHLVLGEREFEHRGTVSLDDARRRFTFRPDPESLWGQRYPNATYHLVTSMPDAVDAIGGDELLDVDGNPGSGTHVAMRTRSVQEFCFAVVGSLTDAAAATVLADKYEQPNDAAALLAPATKFWAKLTAGLHLGGEGSDVVALDASLSWLAHDAMIHLTVPRGLEQYTGAAWGTRDVCQGPVEFLLALEHDAPVKDILRIVFARQFASKGDWPQWFMLEPYAAIADRHAHGDVVVWPLKSLNDYLEATNDLAFLDESLPWRDDGTHEPTAHIDSVAAHVDKLLATIEQRFIPGTQLIRYGEGDWNDSLQPADPALRDAMVSSWTVALLYQQLVRYGEVLRRSGREREAERLAALASNMRDDFNRWLIRNGTVAGYALFEPRRDRPELLLHPSDVRTGLRYSLLPMTRSIIAGLFTPQQA
ncbi:MAG TPA: cellobiose phosphorylase, partial [Casimicrobiaceae bacterium]|nr:cellobiose phosphorylase [Casimicrobiaceae bacterium]